MPVEPGLHLLTGDAIRCLLTVIASVAVCLIASAVSVSNRECARFCALGGNACLLNRDRISIPGVESSSHVFTYFGALAVCGCLVRAWLYRRPNRGSAPCVGEFACQTCICWLVNPSVCLKAPPFSVCRRVSSAVESWLHLFLSTWIQLLPTFCVFEASSGDAFVSVCPNRSYFRPVESRLHSSLCDCAHFCLIALVYCVWVYSLTTEP